MFLTAYPRESGEGGRGSWCGRRGGGLGAPVDPGGSLLPREAVLVILYVGTSDSDSVIALDQLEDDASIFVVAHGLRDREELDKALIAVGAGCVPGHHAELRIDWVRDRLEIEHIGQAPRDPGWLSTSDDDRRWVAAPIAWRQNNGAGSEESAGRDRLESYLAQSHA